MENEPAAGGEKWIPNEEKPKWEQKPRLKSLGTDNPDLPFRIVRGNKGHVLEYDSKIL